MEEKPNKRPGPGGRPRVFSHKAKRLTFKFEEEDHDLLRDLCQRYGSEQSLVVQRALRVLHSLNAVDDQIKRQSAGA